MNVQAAGVKKLCGFLAVLVLLASLPYAYDSFYRLLLRWEYKTQDAKQPLLDVKSEIIHKIREAERVGLLTAADFENLNFYAGDPGKGWNSSSVKLSHASNIAGTIFPLNSDLQERLNLAIEKMTADGRGKVLINIRRFPNRSGELFDHLTLIVTNVKGDVCTSQDLKEMPQLEILPDNHSIAIDDSSPMGCVKNHNNLYYFSEILYRMRDRQDKEWVIPADYVAQPPPSLLKHWESSEKLR